MNIYDRLKIVNYHKKRMSDDKLHSLGWRSKKSQTERYKILAEITDYTDKSVLEPACGYGDFLTFLEEKYDRFTYTGVELVGDFIDRIPDEFLNNAGYSFIKGDFSKLSFPDYDIVVASGLLSYKMMNKNYYFKMIKKMFDLALETAAFNFLDQDIFGKHPVLMAHNKEEIIDYCKSLTTDIKVFEDYLEDDVSIALYK